MTTLSTNAKNGLPFGTVFVQTACGARWSESAKAPACPFEHTWNRKLVTCPECVKMLLAVGLTVGPDANCY